jgi:DNA-binding response OmpR family regulator
VHAAVNGGEALEVLGTFEPSLVLFDLMLGDMTGIDVLSGLKDPDVILDSVGSSGVDYVTKPVMLQEISLKTLIHLHQSKLRRVEKVS